MKQPITTFLLYTCLCISTVTMACDSFEPAAAPLEGTWYKGDLHCHSTHSDGDSSVQEVIASAESLGLDFFVITDHDWNMGGSPSHWYDPDYHSEKMVVLYGVEWTTGLGHANVWASQPFDYEDLWSANRANDAHVAIEAAHAQEALFSINHPSAFLCCPWEYEDDEAADAIEAWNSMYCLPNFNFVSTNVFWDERLLAGRRVTGLGGSDTHQLKGPESIFLRHAEPTTWVFAQERSADAVLEAIRAGRVSVSNEPAGPRVELLADTDGDGSYDAMMGDNVLLPEAREITLSIRMESQDAPDNPAEVFELPPEMIVDEGRMNADAAEFLVSGLLNSGEYLALLIKNGRLHGLWKITGTTTQVDFRERVAPDERVFYRIELWGRPPEDFLLQLLHGITKAVSNPIYFGYPE